MEFSPHMRNCFSVLHIKANDTSLIHFLIAPATKFSWQSGYLFCFAKRLPRRFAFDYRNMYLKVIRSGNRYLEIYFTAVYKIQRAKNKLAPKKIKTGR